MIHNKAIHEVLQRLRDGEVVEVGGIRFQQDQGDIGPGDLYLAGRDTGLHLLTCREVGTGCIHATTWAYSFDLWECVKVKEAQERSM